MVARKRFGQHFLHERHTIERILAAIDPRSGEHLVEIGPGEGALTGPLLAAAGRLEVIELDRDLAAALRARTDRTGELIVHEADALRFDFTALAETRRIRLVGNLPYNISTPLLFHLLEQRHVIHDMHFMLQREVVERMAASPGSRTYGRLSVMTQAFCTVESLFRVAAGAFQPPPAVESAVVRLTPLRPERMPAELEPRFAQVVRQSFGARRKTLRNTLRGQLTAAAIEAAGIDPSCRPERLSVTDFIALARTAEGR